MRACLLAFVHACVYYLQDKTGRRDDTHILNLETLTWSGALDFEGGEGSSPPPRSWHAAAAVDGGRRVLVQGGMCADSMPAGAGAIPGAALAARMGVCGHAISDAWIFELSTQRWTRIDCPPMPRHWHHALSDLYGENLYIFGGNENDDPDPSKSTRLLKSMISASSLLCTECEENVHTCHTCHIVTRSRARALSLSSS